MKTAIWILTAAAVSAAVSFYAGFHVGIADGLKSADEKTMSFDKMKKENAALKQMVTVQKNKSGALTEKISNLEKVVGHSKEVEGESEGMPSELANLDLELKGIDDLVAVLEAITSNPGLRSDDVIETVQEKLLAEIKKSDESLKHLLEKFQTVPQKEVAELIAVALGLYKHPETEKMAFAMAKGGQTDAARLLGLELVQRLDISSPDRAATLAAIIRSEQNPALVQSALYGLKFDAAFDEKIHTEVVVSLKSAVASPDEETRRRAVLALADWDKGQSSDMVSFLKSDKSASVRQAAAFALGNMRFGSQDVVRALVEVISNEKEDTGVRETAWKSLGQIGMLDAQGRAAYSQFKERLEAAKEGQN